MDLEKELRARDIAGLLHLARQLVAALEKADPDNPLCEQQERYAIYLEGYSGRPGIDFNVAMAFTGELRDLFFKSSV